MGISQTPTILKKTGKYVALCWPHAATRHNITRRPGICHRTFADRPSLGFFQNRSGNYSVIDIDDDGVDIAFGHDFAVFPYTRTYWLDVCGIVNRKKYLKLFTEIHNDQAARL